MSGKTNHALDRRSALRVGAVGAAVTAATVAYSSEAGAASGQAVLQGRANNAGADGTTLTSSGSAIALTVKNIGTGAGAFFYSKNSNGFAGGTGSGNRYGLSAANTGGHGNGAALAASGGHNTGILANTNDSSCFALEATNLADNSSVGGGILADGGANPALVTVGDSSTPSSIAIGNTFVVDGCHVAITANSAVYAACTVDSSAVTFDGRGVLDSGGALDIDLSTYHVYADISLEWARLTATPNSGPMPNLWITETPTGARVQGGTPGGKVTWRIVANRMDLPGSMSIPTNVRAAPRDLGVDRVRSTAAAVRANRG